MTNKERLAQVDSIMRRQNAGTITGAQASEEFDEMIYRETGDLTYYSDSTGLVAPWDSNLMLFPKPGATATDRIPSNTGIYARGPKRGQIVTVPEGATPDCMPELLAHFSQTPGNKQ